MNIQYLRDKVKLHIRDVYTTDEEVDSVILQVIEDIAREVKLFRKLSGFTIEKDKQLYDFRNITRLNEEVETELENVYIGGFTDLQMKLFLMGREEWPDPLTFKRTFNEQEFMTFFGVLGLYDEYVRNIMDKFHHTSTSVYMVTDEQWLEDNDGKQMVAMTYGLPKVDELLNEELTMITSCVIEGCKYYFANTLQSATDAQVSNLFYQRYWYKKKELIDQYPLYAPQITSQTKDNKWL